jgi:hypothetical protein
MRWIKDKHLLDGEEPLYTPETHWVYVLGPLFGALCLLFTFPVFAGLSSLPSVPPGLSQITPGVLRAAFVSFSPPYRCVCCGGWPVF